MSPRTPSLVQRASFTLVSNIPMNNDFLLKTLDTFSNDPHLTYTYGEKKYGPFSVRRMKERADEVWEKMVELDDEGKTGWSLDQARLRIKLEDESRREDPRKTTEWDFQPANLLIEGRDESFPASVPASAEALDEALATLYLPWKRQHWHDVRVYPETVTLRNLQIRRRRDLTRFFSRTLLKSSIRHLRVEQTSQPQPRPHPHNSLQNATEKAGTLTVDAVPLVLSKLKSLTLIGDCYTPLLYTNLNTLPPILLSIHPSTPIPFLPRPPPPPPRLEPAVLQRSWAKQQKKEAEALRRSGRRLKPHEVGFCVSVLGTSFRVRENELFRSLEEFKFPPPPSPPSNPQRKIDRVGMDVAVTPRRRKRRAEEEEEEE
ncbi:hypothetical protein BT69DRAFT_1356782 [Atractiella rhizophila]|nr:hypothetical protein BT69DRAFT_1356782 [Atractiella rhizophila]